MLPKLRGGPGILASLPGPVGDVTLRTDVSSDPRVREVLEQLSTQCEDVRAVQLAHVESMDVEPSQRRAASAAIKRWSWWELLASGRPVIECAAALGEAPGALAYWIASELRPPNAPLLEWMAFAFNASGRELQQRDELAHIEQQDSERMRARAAIGVKGGRESGRTRAHASKQQEEIIVASYDTALRAKGERDAVGYTKKLLHGRGLDVTTQTIRNVLDRTGARPKKKRN